eukprot:11112549-Lingulodinium_polyedra.AAC.1
MVLGRTVCPQFCRPEEPASSQSATSGHPGCQGWCSRCDICSGTEHVRRNDAMFMSRRPTM